MRTTSFWKIKEIWNASTFYLTLFTFVFLFNFWNTPPYLSLLRNLSKFWWNIVHPRKLKERKSVHFLWTLNWIESWLELDMDDEVYSVTLSLWPFTFKIKYTCIYKIVYFIYFSYLYLQAYVSADYWKLHRQNSDSRNILMLFEHRFQIENFWPFTEKCRLNICHNFHFYC